MKRMAKKGMILEKPITKSFGKGQLKFMVGNTCEKINEEVKFEW